MIHLTTRDDERIILSLTSNGSAADVSGATIKASIVAMSRTQTLAGPIDQADDTVAKDGTVANWGAGTVIVAFSSSEMDIAPGDYELEVQITKDSLKTSVFANVRVGGDTIA